MALDNGKSMCAPDLAQPSYTDAAIYRKNDPSHIKRPLNAFMVWSKQERQKILERTPDLHNAEISIQLGNRWKNLTEEERKPFLAEANRLRILHSQEYPGYKYQPKKRIKTMSPGKKKGEIKSPSTLERLKRMLKNSNQLRQIISLNAICNNSINSKSSKIVSSSSPTKVSVSSANGFRPQSSSQISEDRTGNIHSSIAVDKPESADQSGFRVIIDKNYKEKLKGTTITPLCLMSENNLPSQDNQSVNPPENKSETTEKQDPQLTQLPDLGGSLMSGPLCAIANASRDEWSETFDFLVQNVIRNTKEAKEDIKHLAKQYKALQRANDIKDKHYNFSECKIVPLSILLGDRWIDEKNEFNCGV